MFTHERKGSLQSSHKFVSRLTDFTRCSKKSRTFEVDTSQCCFSRKVFRTK
jgi:hypothetical protein